MVNHVRPNGDRWQLLTSKVRTLHISPISRAELCSISMSDWTRYAKTKRAAAISQLIGCPLSMSLSCIIGIIVTSCAKEIVGSPVWQPYSLLQVIQQHYNNAPGVRAAVSVPLRPFSVRRNQLTAQLLCGPRMRRRPGQRQHCSSAQSSADFGAELEILNSVAAAIDMTALCPKYLNIRRGAYIVAAVGLATCPWQITSAAGTFLAVLGVCPITYPSD